MIELGFSNLKPWRALSVPECHRKKTSGTVLAVDCQAGMKIPGMIVGSPGARSQSRPMIKRHLMVVFVC